MGAKIYKPDGGTTSLVFESTVGNNGDLKIINHNSINKEMFRDGIISFSDTKNF